MIDFLMWLVLAGTIIFSGLRLWWIYRRGMGHLFWRTRHAKQLYMWAGLLFAVVTLVVFLTAQDWVLLLAIPTIYVLLAFTAVKIDDRGIMASGVFARWQDILKFQPDERDSLILVSTRYSWRKIKLRVPPEKLGDFKKMLAAKGMALSPSMPNLAEESRA